MTSEEKSGKGTSNRMLKELEITNGRPTNI